MAMHQGIFKEIEAFVGRLPMLRQTLSDGQLLDSCQSHLSAFIALVKEKNIPLDPAPPPAAPASAAQPAAAPPPPPEGQPTQ
jgi:hypothetical protein